MTRINTNIASLRGLRSLEKANKILDTSLARLSTGLKINSGKDNPAGLIASETLRLQVTAIEQSIKNSNRANNVIATADSALGEIGGLLNQIRGLIQEGLNDGAISQDEKEANQLQIDAALSAINRISANTQFAGDKLIDGSKAFTTERTVADAAKLTDFQVNEALFGTRNNIVVEATVTTIAEKGQLQYNDNSLTQATTLEVAGSDGSQVLFLGASSSLVNIRDAIDSVSDVTGVEASITNASASFEANASANTFAIQNNAVAATFAQNNTNANADLNFTDRRATANTGVFTDSISIQFIDTGANNETLAVATTTDANGDNVIAITLGTTGAGAVNSTATQVAAAVAANVGANALVTVSATGTGAGVVNDASSGPSLLTGGIDAENITFTDQRTTTLAGANATLGGSVTLTLTDNGNGTALLTNSVQVDANGDIIVSVNLEHDGAGVIQTSVDELLAFINADTNINQYIQATGEGSDLNFANGVIAANALTGGADGYDITFTDARTSPTGDITVVFNDPSQNSQSLNFDVSTDANGDTTVTFNLATDGNGAITTTGSDLDTLITAQTSLNTLIGITETGNGVVQANSGVEIGSEGTLVLSSTNFGSDEFVQVNVLSGSFATTLNDGSTVSGRDSGEDINVIINGQAAEGRGLRAQVRTATLDASLNIAEAFNTINQTASITITGGGSLFQIGQDVSVGGQIGVGIEAVNTARLGGVTGKLFELGTGGGKSLLDVSPDVPGSDLVEIVEQALNRVTTLRGRLGSLQKNVIETNITTLGSALENISAARSQIIDTDFAQETASLTRAQILTQAGISVLSIANQAPAQVLSLLG